MRIVVTVLFLIISQHIHAERWQFTPSIAVTKAEGEGIFHHLESSGRRSIAQSGSTVAVTWEDNRNNRAEIYVAIKPLSAEAFQAEHKLSDKTEGFEPAIVGIGTDSYLVAWEADTSIQARIVEQNGPGPLLKLTDTTGIQPSLSVQKQSVFLVYTDNSSRYQQVKLQHFSLTDNKLMPTKACSIDPAPIKDHQQYPTAEILGNRLIAAWEDRRHGHTIIMAATSSLDNPCRFSSPQQISDPPRQSTQYGKGHGVARVALAAYGNNVMAVWADKRNFREGYDIFAANYSVKQELFGANQKVQDSFGGIAQQWHATIAGNPAGQLIVAWDDNRDGTPRITYSWPDADGWSDDYTIDDEAGRLVQTHPSVVIDNDGNVHLAWIDRKTMSGPTRLRYAYGQYRQNSSQ